MRLAIPALSLCLCLSACSRTDTADGSSAPAVTSLAPPPGAFAGEVRVALSTDKPATIYATVDGTDPRSSPTRVSGESKAELVLAQTAALTFYSVTADGAEEPIRAAVYVRAGGAPGTVSGVVVAGEIALGHMIGLLSDDSVIDLGMAPEEPGEVGFTVTGLGTGSHRLMAFADLDDDGEYSPMGDLATDVVAFDIDAADPFKASLENVRLYLGASKPGLCTVQGVVRVPKPVPGLTLMVAALDPAGLQDGGGDMATLLGQLSSGYRAATNDVDTVYPFVLTDLEPAEYFVVPSLNALGFSNAINLVADPKAQRRCAAGKVISLQFDFGSVSLSGTATLQTTLQPGPFTYGIVVARNLSLAKASVQAVLMPTFFMSDGTNLQGGFAGRALRDGERFDLRAFTNLESEGPFAAALGWAFNPMGSQPAQATFTATPPEVKADFTATIP